MRQSAYLDVTDYNMGLRDKLSDFFQQGSFRDRLQLMREKTQQTASVAAAADPIRGVREIVGKKFNDPIIGTPETDDEYNKMEIESQKQVNAQMGLESDELGNPIKQKDKPEAKPAIIETVSEYKPPKFTKNDLVFQESNVGDGVPYIRQGDTTTSIADVANTLPTTPKKPISAVTITDETGSSSTITDKEQLAVINEIAAVADAVAPEYKNYLIKLAFREGGLKRDAFRPEEKNPGGGEDRGVFQINSKAFPSISQEQANDPRFATLWAISLIESANPVTGDQKREGQEKWYSNDWAKAAQIEIQ